MQPKEEGIQFHIAPNQRRARHGIDEVAIVGVFKGPAQLKPTDEAIVGAVSHAHQLDQREVYFRAPLEVHEQQLGDMGAVARAIISTLAEMESETFLATIERKYSGEYNVDLSVSHELQIKNN